jgi:hypothetical protein
MESVRLPIGGVCFSCGDTVTVLWLTGGFIRMTVCFDCLKQGEV